MTETRQLMTFKEQLLFILGTIRNKELKVATSNHCTVKN